VTEVVQPHVGEAGRMADRIPEPTHVPERYVWRSSGKDERRVLDAWQGREQLSRERADRMH
jgi:hypothetical protein